jgi:hypothetical protein
MPDFSNMTTATKPGWAPEMADVIANRDTTYKNWDKFINADSTGWNIPVTPELLKILGKNQDLVYMKGAAEADPNNVTGSNWLNYGGQYTDAYKQQMLQKLIDYYKGSAEHSKAANGSPLVGQFLNPQNIYDQGMKGNTYLPGDALQSVNIAQARDSIDSVRRQFGNEIADKFAEFVQSEIASARPDATTAKNLPAQQKAIIDQLGKPVSAPVNSANWGAIHGPNPQNSSLTPPTTIDGVYRQILGREPDAEGKAFWESQLQQGNITPQNMAAKIAESASNFDISQYKGPVPQDILIQSINNAKTYLGTGNQPGLLQKTLLPPAAPAAPAPITPVNAPQFSGLFSAQAPAANTNVQAASLFGVK